MWPAVPTTTGRMTFALGSDAADRGSESLELLLDTLVAAVEVVDAGNARLPARHEAAEDERGGGAEIGGHDGSAAQRRHSLDDGAIPVDAYVRAEPLQLGDVGEAVLVDRVEDGAGAVCDGEERHELGLHVGRESRIGRRRDRDRFEPLRRTDSDGGFADLNRSARLLEL